MQIFSDRPPYRVPGCSTRVPSAGTEEPGDRGGRGEPELRGEQISLVVIDLNLIYILG